MIIIEPARNNHFVIRAENGDLTIAPDLAQALAAVAAELGFIVKVTVENIAAAVPDRKGN